MRPELSCDFASSMLKSMRAIGCAVCISAQVTIVNKKVNKKHKACEDARQKRFCPFHPSLNLSTEVRVSITASTISAAFGKPIAVNCATKALKISSSSRESSSCACSSAANFSARADCESGKRGDLS